MTETLRVVLYLELSGYGMVKIKKAIELCNGWYKPMDELDCDVRCESMFNKFITSALMKLGSLDIEYTDDVLHVEDLSDIQLEKLNSFMNKMGGM